MPNVSTIAICPYYKTEDTYSVICEGIVEIKNAKTKNNVRFSRKEKKEKWIDMYCKSYTYCNCPYAKLLNKKYNE